MDISMLRHWPRRNREPTRSCVLLAYYEGYSREELAARFDKPVNTIKTWLHRGPRRSEDLPGNDIMTEDTTSPAAEYVLGTLHADERTLFATSSRMTGGASRRR